jgi:hypothetical protein
LVPIWHSITLLFFHQPSIAIAEFSFFVIRELSNIFSILWGLVKANRLFSVWGSD